MSEKIKGVFIKQMLLPKEELALQTMELMADKMELEKQVEQLENIRKETIEYIENNWITYNDSKDFTEFNEELPVFIKEINILLNILNKGENNGK